MTKPTTKYGMVGIVAFAAILSISLIANAANTQTADAVPANKFAWTSEDSFVTVEWKQGEETKTSTDNIGPLDIHSSEGNYWNLGLTLECLTASEVQATGGKGKSKELSGAVSGATVTLIVDKDTTDEKRYYSWTLCQHDLKIEADLNQLIEFNPDTELLEFVCDPGDEDFLSDRCQQWIAIYSSVAGAYHAEWVIQLGHGDHTYDFEIISTAEASGDTTDADLDDEPNGVTSMVVIDRVIVTGEPVHLAQQQK